MATDRIIRWSTAGAVVGVAAVATAASYEHAYDLVRAHGEVGWTARLVPLTVDGLIYASSMVMLDSARRKAPVPGLVRWLLGLGIAATFAANVAYGLGHGLIGAAVAAWPAVALVRSYELLMLIIRVAQSQEPKADASGADSARGPEADPLALGQLAVTALPAAPVQRDPVAQRALVHPEVTRHLRDRLAGLPHQPHRALPEVLIELPARFSCHRRTSL
jgi:hypothetical protein